jgi:hypothetical protein
LEAGKTPARRRGDRCIDGGRDFGRKVATRFHNCTISAIPFDFVAFNAVVISAIMQFFTAVAFAVRGSDGTRTDSL